MNLPPNPFNYYNIDTIRNILDDPDLHYILTEYDHDYPRPCDEIDEESDRRESLLPEYWQPGTDD